MTKQEHFDRWNTFYLVALRSEEEATFRLVGVLAALDTCKQTKKDLQNLDYLRLAKGD